MSWAGVLALGNFALLLALLVAGAILLRRAGRRVSGPDRRGRAQW